jgi:hypothetical protein
MALFIGGAAHLARLCGTRRVTGVRQVCSTPRGVLIRHAAPPLNPLRFSCEYCFLTRFSRAILEVFWCSKCVMKHIVGKLATSNFQRCKVCANRNLDEKVMAPGS